MALRGTLAVTCIGLVLAVGGCASAAPAGRSPITGEPGAPAAPCGFVDVAAFVAAVDAASLPAQPLEGTQPFAAGCVLRFFHGTKTIEEGGSRVYEVTPPGWRGAWDPAFATATTGLRVGMSGGEVADRTRAAGLTRVECSRFDPRPDEPGIWQCIFEPVPIEESTCAMPSEVVRFELLPQDPDPDPAPRDAEALALVAGRAVTGIVLAMPCHDD